MISLNVNGRTHQVDVDSATPLLWVLREVIGMTGTKFGCGAALCGACTVHVDGAATRSCQLPVGELAGRRISTIEGANGREAEALLRAWTELDVAQCGYCQPGQIMQATDLLKAKPQPTDADIDAAMNGNICRCATYQRIRAGIHHAAKLINA